MLSNYSKYFMRMNMIEDVDFTFDDDCIWVTHTSGASGDLIASIIDKHYINTGCQYYGINENGQVIFVPADDKGEYLRSIKKIDINFLYEVAECLSRKQLNYSLLDNIIFTSHTTDYDEILSTFKKAKIINIYNDTEEETDVINKMCRLKNDTPNTIKVTRLPEQNDRILNIPFKSIFTEEKFEEIYTEIVNFLNLSGKLIRFDFIKFYISKQKPEIQEDLLNL